MVVKNRRAPSSGRKRDAYRYRVQLWRVYVNFSTLTRQCGRTATVFA
jgi:hypothetical protein|tara:strand:- start:504 stop:644 length:141 start_codon:yes stop_codon:yes gene_type:complete